MVDDYIPVVKQGDVEMQARARSRAEAFCKMHANTSSASARQTWKTHCDSNVEHMKAEDGAFQLGAIATLQLFVFLIGLTSLTFVNIVLGNLRMPTPPLNTRLCLCVPI